MFAGAYFPERACGAPCPPKHQIPTMTRHRYLVYHRWPHLCLSHTLPSRQVGRLVQISDSCHLFGTMKCLLAPTLVMSREILDHGLSCQLQIFSNLRTWF